MTQSAETLDSETGKGPLDARWRATATQVQQRALASGPTVVSCPAAPGVGGLGRHLAELTGALDHDEQLTTCICESTDAGRAISTQGDPRRRLLNTALAPLARVSPSWRMWGASVGFDSAAARALPQSANLIAFNGTALAQFRAAARIGFESISLVAANSHYRNVLRQHDRAYRQYPVERPWANRLLQRNLSEYEQAQRIYVASRYIWQSFVDEGLPESRLSLFPLTPDPRFRPAGAVEPASTPATFDVVYVGSLTVHKGVPLLIDAVRRLPFEDLRLVLVGGWGTRGMRRFVQSACAADPRILLRPGDPLARLQAARLCVHPAYEDGFAYAPVEAMACGVPVIVSEDTGMKELIDPGRTGIVTPTGDLAALTAAIEAAYRGQAFGG